jgi:hypothetical protein
MNKSSLAIRIGHEFRRQHFDGNEAVQMLITRLVDNSHPSLTETRKDLVVADAPTH